MAEFTLSSTMREVESRFPFSRQILFQQFHLGGCGNCGFAPDETVSQVAEKHSKNALDIVTALNDGLSRLQDSYITGAELKGILERREDVVMVDVREPWEREIASIEGSVLLDEQNIEFVFEKAKQSKNVVVVCHHGLRAMNATMYMHEQGIPHARCLKGGTDAYSLEVDPTLPRY